MRLFIVCGSPRPDSQTRKVCDYISNLVLAVNRCNEVFCLDLGVTPLPLWQENLDQISNRWPPGFEMASRALAESDAIVAATPEWNGMATPSIKNFFLFCNNGEVAHKPALLVAVSSVRGGSYPIAELRMSSYKNTRICHIPESVIVHDVAAVLNTPLPACASDEYVRRRLRAAVEMLSLYADALDCVRRKWDTAKGFRYSM